MCWVQFYQPETPRRHIAMLLNTTNGIFVLVSNITLPEELTLSYYPEQPERLTVIYWNLYVVLKSSQTALTSLPSSILVHTESSTPESG